MYQESTIEALSKIKGVQTGIITEFLEDGKILVEIQETQETIPCFMIQAQQELPEFNLGDTVAFTIDQKQQGLILGIVKTYPVKSAFKNQTLENIPDRLELKANQSIDLICGENTIHLEKYGIVIENQQATISINRDGEVTTQGTKIKSRSDTEMSLKAPHLSLN